MATRTQLVRISDLSGEDLGEGGLSVNFSVGSDAYTIDLSDKEAEKFFDTLKKYTDVATKTSGRGVRRSSGSSGSRAANAEELAKVRAWAAENNIEVSARGRIPQSVRDAYDAAQ